MGEVVTLLLAQWGPILVLVVVVLAMLGWIGKGAGMFHLFRDDDEIFGGRELGGIESRFAGAGAPVPGWWGWVVRLFASPAFWSGAGLAVLVGLSWLMAFTAGAEAGWLAALQLLPGADGVAPVARAALLAVLLVSVAASWAMSRAHLGHLRSDFGEWSDRRRRDEPVRAALGGGLGLLAVMGLHWLIVALGAGVTGPWGAYLLVAVPFALPVLVAINRPHALPAVSIFSFAILLVLGFAALARLGGPWAQLGLIAAVAWVIRANGRLGKYRLPGFAALYDRPEDPGRGRSGGHADRLTPQAVLTGWRKRLGGAEDGPKPVLVLLATSGGAYRATFWTSLILDRLIAGSRGAEARWPGLDGNIRLITGASGGMVAGAYFVGMNARGALEPGAEVGAYPVTDRIIADTRKSLAEGCGRRQPIGRDSLSPLVHQMVRGDFWHSFLPGTPTTDRGRVLEAQWPTLAAPEATFAALKPAEAEGRAPSIVLSPMLVESGALALFSNLDLGALRERSTRIHDRAGAELQASVEVLDQFEGTQEAISLATAVRLNASFPYVSPAVSLPTTVDRRVVDAGYFDNYGIDIACGLLEEPEVCAWVQAHCAGVAVIELRAFEAEPLTRPVGAMARAFQFLTSPPEALFSARRASQIFRNNQQLKALRDRFGKASEEAGDFLRVFTFEAVSDVSMSWYLRLDEVDALDALLSPPAPDDLAAAQALLRDMPGATPEARKARFLQALREEDPAARRARHVLQRQVIAAEFAALEAFWAQPHGPDPRAGAELPTWMAALDDTLSQAGGRAVA